MAAWKVARCAVLMVAPGRASPYAPAPARPRTRAAAAGQRGTRGAAVVPREDQHMAMRGAASTAAPCVLLLGKITRG
eukprot:scaffold36824_cov41-Phaeocystis_antarctica.AAC.1